MECTLNLYFIRRRVRARVHQVKKSGKPQKPQHHHKHSMRSNVNQRERKIYAEELEKGSRIEYTTSEEKEEEERGAKKKQQQQRCNRIRHSIGPLTLNLISYENERHAH